MRIGVVGCCGRIGRLVLAAIEREPQCVLAGGIASPTSAWLGHDVSAVLGGKLRDIRIEAAPEALCSMCDVLIDFSTPSATATCAVMAARHGVAFVTGTTGLGPAEQEIVASAASHVAVVQASHMSLAANLLLAAVREWAIQLDSSYDIEVLAKTHRDKIDAPSGTALALARAAAAGRGDKLGKLIRTQPHSGKRPPGTIGVVTMQGGSHFSEHTVLFAGANDRLEFSHTVLSYDVCAEGALRAAIWACERQPGLYSMLDVLGIQ